MRCRSLVQSDRRAAIGDDAIPWVTCAAGRAAEAGRDGATASAGDGLSIVAVH